MKKESVKVNLKFINKKGEIKNVNFYIDKKTFDVLNKTDISFRQKYLLEEYYRTIKDMKYRRVNKSIESFIENCSDMVDFESDLESKLNDDELIEALLNSIKKLNKEQKEIIEEYFFKGKTLEMIAKEKGVSYPAIRQKKCRAIENLKKNLKNF